MIDAFEAVRWAMVFARWGEEFVIGQFVDFFIEGSGGSHQDHREHRASRCPCEMDAARRKWQGQRQRREGQGLGASDSRDRATPGPVQSGSRFAFPPTPPRVSPTPAASSHPVVPPRFGLVPAPPKITGSQPTESNVAPKISQQAANTGRLL